MLLDILQFDALLSVYAEITLFSLFDTIAGNAATYFLHDLFGTVLRPVMGYLL